MNFYVNNININHSGNIPNLPFVQVGQPQLSISASSTSQFAPAFFNSMRYMPSWQIPFINPIEAPSLTLPKRNSQPISTIANNTFAILSTSSSQNSESRKNLPQPNKRKADSEKNHDNPKKVKKKLNHISNLSPTFAQSRDLDCQKTSETNQKVTRSTKKKFVDRSCASCEISEVNQMRWAKHKITGKEVALCNTCGLRLKNPKSDLALIYELAPKHKRRKEPVKTWNNWSCPFCEKNVATSRVRVIEKSTQKETRICYACAQYFKYHIDKANLSEEKEVNAKCPYTFFHKKKTYTSQISSLPPPQVINLVTSEEDIPEKEVLTAESLESSEILPTEQQKSSSTNTNINMMKIYNIID